MTIKDKEQKLRQRNISEHFQVPEGYFENFATAMMEKLPEQPFQPLKLNIHRESPLLRIAAAVATFFVLSISGYALLHSSTTHMHEVEGVSTASATIVDDGNDDKYTFEEAAEYAMIDLQDMHELISE